MGRKKAVSNDKPKVKGKRGRRASNFAVLQEFAGGKFLLLCDGLKGTDEAMKWLSENGDEETGICVERESVGFRIVNMQPLIKVQTETVVRRKLIMNVKTITPEPEPEPEPEPDAFMTQTDNAGE